MGHASQVGDMICIPLVGVVQQTATNTAVTKALVPVKCRIVRIEAWVDVIGGTTKPTDYDIIVKNGATALHTAVAAVNTSTNKGPQAGTLVSTPATLAMAGGTTLTLTTTLTGGASPTVDGIHARVWAIRE